ncbi:MAG: integrase core domain-containing protein [Vicinamibacteria bacterium]
MTTPATSASIQCSPTAGRQGANNIIWAADETFFTREKIQTTVFGLIDHGSRACLTLTECKDRTAIGIFRLILDAIEKYGRPLCIRTDNGPAFRSRLFTLALTLLGIKHVRIDPSCPWQNGRIERLFGTLKTRISLWWQQAGAPLNLTLDLETVRAWYNHARPHQSLRGLTPAMAWSRTTDLDSKSLHYFRAWGGILTGFVARC